MGENLTHKKDFLRLLESRSPNTPITKFLLATNIAIALLMTIESSSFLFSPKVSQVAKWGANFAPNIFLEHEYYRLITSNYLHFGLIHLFFNMFCLIQLGPFLERVYKSGNFFIIYTLSGVLSSLTSQFFSPHSFSAGASGAIFGLFGSLIVLSYSKVDFLPGKILKRIRNSIGQVLLINLIIGLSIDKIDNSAHFGGLVSGMIITKLVSPFIFQKSKSNFIKILTIYLGSIAVIIAITFGIEKNKKYSDWIFEPQKLEIFEEFVENNKVINKNLDRFNQIPHLVFNKNDQEKQAKTIIVDLLSKFKSLKYNYPEAKKTITPLIQSLENYQKFLNGEIELTLEELSTIQLQLKKDFQNNQEMLVKKYGGPFYKSK